ncbi:MAG: hypothetical protein IIC97_12175 [Chloroflexi bacterium]|nr:hypothetical protein [Chloroflexota bacterium]MCH9017847.1 hypothetical protein [Chloroflexota bacterium]
MLCLLKNCRKCNGDLVLDGEEWRCWQCGQYYYPITESLDQREGPPNPGLAAAIGEIMPSQRKTRVRRSPRNLNSRIVARDRSDSRWWERNRDVVKYLDQGLSVREISNLVSHGERQVRIIRERLHDLRTNNPEGEALAAVA